MLKTPVVSRLYQTCRKRYHTRQFIKAARNHVINLGEYQKALVLEDGKVVDIQMRDGLVIALRRNYMDAVILAETFFERQYMRGFSFPEKPVVIDIGGFIGDSALFAAKHLNARKVIVCEPSPKNLELLRRNVARNHFEGQIEIVDKAVTDGRKVFLNIDAENRAQARVSAYDTSPVEKKAVPVITLADLMKEYAVEQVDLLKIDCEGGEYGIFASTSPELLRQIRNIVFEYHEIEGYQDELKSVIQKLSDAGFTVQTHGNLVYASLREKSGGRQN